MSVPLRKKKANRYHILLIDTANRGIKLFASGLAQDYGAQMAGATLVLVPVIIAFFLCQKYFVEGITAGAVKG